MPVLVNGDTPWLVTITGTASLDTLVSPGDKAAGARRLVVPASSSAALNKQDGIINMPDDGVALHMVARVRMNSALATPGSAFIAAVGLGNDNVANNGTAAASDVGVWLKYTGSTGVWNTATAKGTSQTVTATPEAPTADTWQWVDILCVSQDWAAFWVDGSGPYITATNVPLVTDAALEPFVYCLTPAAASTAHFSVDVIRAALVTPVQDPNDWVYNLQQSQLSEIAG